MTNLTLRIDWADMDLFGHVNNVAFFRYVQAARVHFWEAVGIGATPSASGTGAILASTACQFMRPLGYPGQVQVQTHVAGVRTTSFELHHQLFDQSNQLAAQAQDAIVLFDYQTSQKIPMPHALKLRLMAESDGGPVKKNTAT